MTSNMHFQTDKNRNVVFLDCDCSLLQFKLICRNVEIYSYGGKNNKRDAYSETTWVGW